MLLAGVTVGVYSSALSNPFVNYDDPDYVTENAHIQQGLTSSTVEWAFGTTTAGNWHPLTWLSHALDCDLYGLDPWGHHLTSILFHCVNAVLIFLLLYVATRKLAPSLVVAALFALHTLNVESVAWVAERKTVLSMFFFLLALGAYGYYARKPTRGRYLTVAALFALALMAKPMAVTFPCVLVLIDFWPLGRVAGAGAPSNFALPQYPLKELLTEKLSLFGLAAMSSVITIIAQRPALKTMSAIPLGARLANAVYSYPMYLWQAIWPTHLGVFYAPQGVNLGVAKILLCSLLLCALTAASWLGRTRPYITIGWLWFLGTLVPMIGLVQAGEQGMADRYTYLPMLGIFFAVAFAIFDLCMGRKHLQWAVLFMACLALSLLAARTRRQITFWQSSYALWSHSLEIEKNNYVAEDFVGFSLLESGSASTGQGCVDEALIHFRRAITINPEDALGHVNVGFCEQQRGQLNNAIGEFNAAVTYARSRFLKQKAYTNLGSAYEGLGDDSNARLAYERALELAPNDRDVAERLRRLSRAVVPAQ